MWIKMPERTLKRLNGDDLEISVKDGLMSDGYLKDLVDPVINSLKQEMSVEAKNDPDFRGVIPGAIVEFWMDSDTVSSQIFTDEVGLSNLFK